MTPGLIFPIGLAALAALILPLVIHIARRSEQLPTDFAALRWLRQKPRPRSRLKFDEWPLLLLRLLLLALVALWLAQPVLFGAGGTSPYVAVVPGVNVEQAQIEEGAKLHWLAPGFPDHKQPRPDSDVPFASLIRQLDADLPAGVPLTILVPAIITGADAERPRLSRPVTWQVVPTAIPAPDMATPPPVVIPSLSIHTDAAHGGAVSYLRAAALSWQAPGREADVTTAGLDAAPPTAPRSLIYLGAGTLPPAMVRWVEAGGVVMIAADTAMPDGQHRSVIWRDDLDRPLVETQTLGKGRVMRFTRRLTPAEMPELLETDFPVRLKALFDPPKPAPTRVAASDYTPLTGGPKYEQAPQDIRPWLAILIGLLLVGERWLATQRRRGLVP